MPRTYIADARNDIGFALRLLRQTPGFAAIAVATLALGIGASATMFTIVDAVLLHPLPFADADRLIMVRPSSGSRLSAGYLQEWRLGSRAFADITGWQDVRVNLVGRGTPLEVQADRTTTNFFATLGASPIVGRTFTHYTDLSRAEPEVVLGYGLWQRRFGGDPGVVGQAITLDGERLTVVGVMAKGFTIRTTERAESQAELWLPLRLNRAPENLEGMGGNLHVVGRLAPGATAGQAQASLATIARRLEAEHPSYSHDWTVGVLPLLEATVMDVRLTLLVLLGAVGILLLIACANVAHLVLSRATKRHTELAIRFSLGATFGRLIRQFTMESLVLAAVGGGIGVGLATWGTRAVLGVIPAGFDLPRIQEVGVDWRMLGFATAATLASAFLAGVAPLVSTVVTARPQALALNTRDSSSVPRKRLRSILVVSEVALAIVLLAGAGLLLRSFMGLTRVNPGFGSDRVLTLRTTLAASKYTTDERIRLFAQQMLSRIERVPGVAAVGTVNYLPLNRFGAGMLFRIETGSAAADREQKFSWASIVGGRYFEAMGIPLLRGRLPDDRDHERAEAVFVIDEGLARGYWPDSDPIGARLTWDVGNDEELTGEVIGVVGSVHWRGLAAESEPTTYFWAPQIPVRELTVVTRTLGDPVAVARGIAAQISALDPDQPASDIRLMRELIAADLAQPRFTMLLLTGFAAASLVLAAIGLYGAISFSTAQRTREIAIRMALGARRQDVLRLVLQSGLRLTAIGGALGIAATLALGRLVTGLLYGVAAADPLTLLIVVSVVGLIAVIATYIPAHRATRLDPTAALAE